MQTWNADAIQSLGVHHVWGSVHDLYLVRQQITNSYTQLRELKEEVRSYQANK